MSVNIEQSSYGFWYSEIERHRCGYCKNPKGSISYGMSMQQLTVHDYQDLIDRGWRRSGSYCYKPIMNQTCCPQYTIKCDALNLQLTKSQKKVMKKFNKFLGDGVLSPRSETPAAEESNDCREGVSDRLFKDVSHLKSKLPELKKTILNCIDIEIKGQGDINVEHQLGKSTASSLNEATLSCGDSVPQRMDVKANKEGFKKGVGADASKPPAKKAKVLRLERKKQKLLQRGMSLENISSAGNVQKSLEEFLNEIPANLKHKLTLRLIPTCDPDEEWDQVENVEFELYKKYQMIIHNDPPEKCTKRGFYRFLVSSPLKIRLEAMHANHINFRTSANLFAKYQRVIHNDSLDECNESQFYAFLVDTPLKPEPFPDDTEGLGFGSFHQQYWLDDKLLAVGVIDVLPKCVSSVYFFYDPDYRNLTLGTLGSMRELAFTRHLNSLVPSIESYYMGYYIHSCPKMRYKCKLVPSFLLCPESYVWVPIEKCLPKLDTSKYSRLSEPDAKDAYAPTSVDVDEIKFVIFKKITTFGFYKRYMPDQQEDFNNIAKLIGRKCLKNFVFEIA